MVIAENVELQRGEHTLERLAVEAEIAIAAAIAAIDHLHAAPLAPRIAIGFESAVINRASLRHHAGVRRAKSAYLERDAGAFGDFGDAVFKLDFRQPRSRFARSRRTLNFQADHFNVRAAGPRVAPQQIDAAGGELQGVLIQHEADQDRCRQQDRDEGFEHQRQIVEDLANVQLSRAKAGPLGRAGKHFQIELCRMLRRIVHFHGSDEAVL